MSIIFFFTFFSFLLLSFTQLFFSSTHTPTHSRRALHQSFFPLTSSPSPAQPPSPSFPKYPSSSSSSQNSQRPFFPRYPSPPPPPSPTISSSLPTFPANISSILSPPRHRSPAKLAPAIVLPLLALVLVAVSLGLILLHVRRRRRRAAGKDARSDSLRLFPPNSTASDGRKLSSSSSSGPAASDFLYLGTLVSSRGRADEPAAPAAACGSPYRKLDSPELRPLPPLPRQCRNADGGGVAGGSSEEEFFSPKGSPGQKGSPKGPASSSRKAFAMEKCGSRSSTLSSASYPSSIVASLSSPSSPTTSSPPVGLSPGRSTVKSRNSRAESVVVGDVGLRSFPPPPPPPPSLLRPQTPSPPKRKPSSPSPPYSPPAVDTSRKAATLELPSQNLISPRRIGDFARNPFAVSMPQRQISPPPPPPPPPAGYWEGQNPKMQACQPPVLMPPRTSGMRNSSATVFPAGPLENSNDMEKNQCNLRPKLKPLHWDKVRASSDRAMVWDQLKSSSFQLNEEMIETLFVCNTNVVASKETTGRLFVPSVSPENRILDPKKSQNIAILLKALNVTREEVCQALLEGNTVSLGNELLEILIKMAPSKEEELKLKEYKDDSHFKLDSAEQFLKAVLDIPFAFKRVDAMHYFANFDLEVNCLRNSFRTLEAACEELRNSRMFRKLLEAVLKTGNRMNVGTNRGDAHAFKLDTLLKLVDVKGTDGKTTLLHFVVQEIIRAEGSRFTSANSTTKNQMNTLQDDLERRKIGLRVVSGLGEELTNVKKAASMDSDLLSSNTANLAGGIGKIYEVLRLNDTMSSKECGQQFHDAMREFLRKAEDDIIKIQDQESITLSLVKEITEYFHGDSAKEEAHPFRIFMVVRDFLTILDRVCKEVDKVNERAITSTARQLPVLVNPAAFSGLNIMRSGSSDDESSSSS